jgi:hypothetical protein
MATTTINARTFLLKVSPDNGTSKYTLVCIEKHEAKRSRDVQERDTQCGLLTSRKAPKRTFPFSLVVNTTPAALAAGVGEASLELLLTWFENETALTIYRNSPDAGTDLYETGTVYITRLDDAAQVGEYVTVDGEFTGDGTFDITA